MGAGRGRGDLVAQVKLNQDMVSYSGGIVHVPMTTASFGTRSGNAQRATLYEEGPWFYKRGGLYSLVFASDCCSPEKIDYATSTGPTGTWAYRSRIMDDAGSASFTNHPGVVDHNGKSYFFYHDGALPRGNGYRRSVCVEQVNYNADGTIPTIKMTSAGPAALANLNPYAQVEAETMAFSGGPTSSSLNLKTEVCSEGGMDVTAIGNGDYVKRLQLVSDAHARLEAAGYAPIGFDHFALPADPLARAVSDGTLHRNFRATPPRGPTRWSAWGCPPSASCPGPTPRTPARCAATTPRWTPAACRPNAACCAPPRIDCAAI